MDFWVFLVVIVLGVTTIEAIKDIVKSRAVNSKDVEAIHEEIALVRKDIAEIKEYVADLIIRNDGYDGT